MHSEGVIITYTSGPDAGGFDAVAESAGSTDRPTRRRWLARAGVTTSGLLALSLPPTGAAGGTPGRVAVRERGGVVRIDAGTLGRAISPLIYGVAHATAEQLSATGARLHRWGGNPNSRYNWELGSAWNAARDWEFRNYGEGREAADDVPSGSADRFVQLNRDHMVASFLTVPALGWVARNGQTGTRSTGVPAGGGSPSRPSGDAINGYDPITNRRETSVRSRARKGAGFVDPPDTADGTVFQDEWIAHLVRRFGPAAEGGVGYYVVDNEPDLWAETHTDVYPVRPDYARLLSVFIEYATAIKDVDPTAQVAGPALSGWLALFHSPRDREAMGSIAGRLARRVLSRGGTALGEPDRQANGGQAFLPWWLDQIRHHDERSGRRSLDVLDVHWYPQAPGVYAGGGQARTDPATNALRLRSTRALWDPAYVDESWIGEPVRLIPRLREWIDRAYPGTRLAIGEWNWGADQTVNGALAIADVLGIFGREGVNLAAYWSAPGPGTPGERAFALYTNFDGEGGAFGDVSLPTASSIPQDIAVFASRQQSSGALVIVMLNKQSDESFAVSVRLDGLPPGGPLQVRQFRFLSEAQLATPGLDERQLPPNAELEVLLPAGSATILHLLR